MSSDDKSSSIAPLTPVKVNSSASLCTPTKVKSSSVDMGPMKTPPRCSSSKKKTMSTTPTTTTPGGIDSSSTKKTKKKTYPFRGNIRSPAPKADEILLRHLSSPEQQAQVIKERVNNVQCKYGENKFQELLSGATLTVGQEGKKLDKLIQSSDNPKKLRSKLYHRMDYLKQIQKYDPDSFMELCRYHNIHPHGGIILPGTKDSNGAAAPGGGSYGGVDVAALKKLVMMQNDANEYEALAAAGAAAAAVARPETVFSSSSASTSTATARKIDFQGVEDDEEDTENHDPKEDKAINAYRDNTDDGEEADDEDEASDYREGDDSSPTNASNQAKTTTQKKLSVQGDDQKDITIDELNNMFQDLMSNMVRYHVQDIMRDGKNQNDEN